MNYHEIVKKLVGPIKPVGSSETDSVRFENLKILTALVENLIMDINDVGFENQGSQFASMKKAGEYATDFINRISLNK